MGLGVKITISLLAVLFLAVIYPAMYLSALNMVDVEDVTFSELKISGKGVMFVGTIILDNPGAVAVTVDEITYRVILESTDEQLGSGTITGARIPSGKTATLLFENTLDWKPNLATAQKLLAKDILLIRIEGDASAKFLSMTFTKPFAFTTDIHSYLQQYVQELLRNPTNALQQLGSMLGLS